MSNLKSIRIRKALISPTTPRSSKFYFRHKNQKILQSHLAVNEPKMQSDPFAELKNTNNKKLKPVILKHAKKFSSGHAESLALLNVPQAIRIDLKKIIEKKEIFLPAIQKEAGFNYKSLSHNSQGLIFRPAVDRRESFKDLVKGHKDLMKGYTRGTIDEKAFEVSFGK